MPTVTATPNKAARRLETVSSAAEYLGVSTKTLRRMIARGDLRAFRMGSRMIRVDRAELDELLRPIPTVGGSGDAA
jgi:excisionase family DNA binding protein